MIVSVLGIFTVDIPYVTNRYRSYYCEKYKSMYYGLDNTTTFATGVDKKCTVPSYQKPLDDQMATDTINFVRWAAGYNNTVSVDDTFHDQQCASVAYMNNNWGTSYPYEHLKCYTPDLFAPYLTSVYSSSSPNTAALVHLLMSTSDTWCYGKVHKLRGYLMQRNTSTFSTCGVGKHIALKLGNMFKQDKTQDPQMVVWPHPGPLDVKLFSEVWTLFIPSWANQFKITVKVNGNLVTLRNTIQQGGDKGGNGTSIQRNYNDVGAGFGILFSPQIENIKPNMMIDVSVLVDNAREYKWSYYTTDCGSDISDSDFDKQFGRKSQGPQSSAEKKKKALAIGLSVFFVLLIIIGAVVGFFVWWKFCKKPSNDSYHSENDQQVYSTETTTTTTTNTYGRRNTLTFESREEQYSQGSSDPQISRKTIIIA